MYTEYENLSFQYAVYQTLLERQTNFRLKTDVTVHGQLFSLFTI